MSNVRAPRSSGKHLASLFVWQVRSWRHPDEEGRPGRLMGWYAGPGDREHRFESQPLPLPLCAPWSKLFYLSKPASSTVYLNTVKITVYKWYLHKPGFKRKRGREGRRQAGQPQCWDLKLNRDSQNEPRGFQGVTFCLNYLCGLASLAQCQAHSRHLKLLLIILDRMVAPKDMSISKSLEPMTRILLGKRVFARLS